VAYFEEGIVMSAALSYETIDPPGSTYSVAEEINDKGQIVGLVPSRFVLEFDVAQSPAT
jgi:hypothetical protein